MLYVESKSVLETPYSACDPLPPSETRVTGRGGGDAAPREARRGQRRALLAGVEAKLVGLHISWGVG